MIKLLINKKGVALMEVMIALFILSIAGVSVGASMYMSIRTTDFNQNELIASNLAREGIEAVRNTIETNWLRCPHNKADSWLIIDTSNNCSSTDLLKDKNYYTISFNSGDLNWDINTIGTSPTDAMDSKYLLYTKAISGVDYYLHDNSASTASPFHRQIKMEISGDTVKITSTVAWQDRSRVADVTLVGTITNSQ